MQNAAQQMQIKKKPLFIFSKVVSYKFVCQHFKTRLQSFKTAFSFAIRSNIIKISQKISVTSRNTQLNCRAFKIESEAPKLQIRCCMISLDEMSLRTGLKYDMPTGSIVGFENDGKPHSKKIATSAFCVMVNKIFKRYKYPIGYIFSESVMKPSLIIKTIKSSIKVCDKAGLIVKMITSLIKLSNNLEWLLTNLFLK